MKPKLNPGKLTTKQRLADAIRERDEASTSCIALIAITESLIKLLRQITCFDQTDSTIRDAWERIREARRGK